MFFSKAPSMTLGIAALAAPGRGPRDDLWMGSAAGEPIPWRVLSREGNGGRQAIPGVVCEFRGAF